MLDANDNVADSLSSANNDFKPSQSRSLDEWKGMEQDVGEQHGKNEMDVLIFVTPFKLVEKNENWQTPRLGKMFGVLCTKTANG